MKKKDLYALACIFCLAGCSDPASDELEIVQNLYPVQFSVELQKEILPFSPTRSMPPNTVPEPTVNDDSGKDPSQEDPNKELSEICSVIDYLIFNDNDLSAPIREERFEADKDQDFGIVYDKLPAGSYKVYFMAHQLKEATIEGNVFSADEVPDVFYRSIAITVGNEEFANIDVSLQRIVSRIEFKASDAVPDEAKQFDLSIDNYPNQFDILEGKGVISDTSHNISHTFTSEEKLKTGTVHSFYTFIPPGNEKIAVTLTTTDNSSNILRTRTVANISPIANKIIRYTGILYTPPKPDETESTYQMEIENNGKWGDTIEKELGE